MTKKRISSIDLDTGEILEGSIVLVNPKRKMSFYNGHFSMAHEPLLGLANAIGDSAETMKVFLALLHKFDYENIITLNQTDLARKINMKTSNVSRAIKRLVSEGVLIVDHQKEGVHKRYRFNPLLIWKGSAKTHAKAVKEYARNTGLRGR